MLRLLGICEVEDCREGPLTPSINMPLPGEDNYGRDYDENKYKYNEDKDEVMTMILMMPTTMILIMPVKILKVLKNKQISGAPKHKMTTKRQMIE